jgi:G:T-mismatch repair DNA endonuclease (very short patch repair protein)
MRALGFRVGIVWQCELEDERRLARKLSKLVAASRRTTQGR